jgi:hypothetical protein
MKSISRWPSKRMSLDVLVGIVVWFSISPTHAQGQAGYNAVYNSNGNCSSTSPCTASSAFVDVSAVTQHADICDTIYLSILSSSSYPQNGEVAGPPLGFWQRWELMPPRVATLVLGLAAPIERAE